MPRNLDHRIEVMTPVYNPTIKEELKRIVEWGLADTLKGRLVDGSGDNLLLALESTAKPFRSQEELYNYYEKQIADSRAALNEKNV